MKRNIEIQPQNIMNVQKRIKEFAEVISGLRRLLQSKMYIEIKTPVIRKTTSKPFPRVSVNGYDKYLRDSMEISLRYNLKYFDRIYEIGPCFRNEKNGANHLNEFTMLELYSKNETLNDLIDLSIEIINDLNISFPLKRISVAKKIAEDFNIDLEKDDDSKLATTLRKENETDVPDYDIINKYIEENIEILSKGNIAILFDYPISTISGAKRKDKTIGIINRFEIFINGIEVFHGYEDECNLPLYKGRSEKVDLFNYEEKIIYNELETNSLPNDSVGLGIGVERLCMSKYNVSDIKEYHFSNIF